MSLSVPQHYLAIPKGLLGTLHLVPGRQFALVQLLHKWECGKTASWVGVGWGPLPAAPAGGTSDICYCWYQPWFYRKKSSRPRGRAGLHGAERETPSLDSDAPRCRALVVGGMGPCGSCVFLFGHRE